MYPHALHHHHQQWTLRVLLRPHSVTVQVGADTVVRNLHHVYGPLRLPLLIHGWAVLHRIRDGGKI